MTCDVQKRKKEGGGGDGFVVNFLHVVCVFQLMSLCKIIMMIIMMR